MGNGRKGLKKKKAERERENFILCFVSFYLEGNDGSLNLNFMFVSFFRE